MTFGAGSQSSETKPGYYDKNTQGYRDRFFSDLWGTPEGGYGGKTTTYSTGSTGSSVQKPPSWMPGPGGRGPRAPSYQGGTTTITEQYTPIDYGKPGGLAGQLFDTSNKYFTGSGTYNPKDFGDTEYLFNYQAPDFSKYNDVGAELITKNLTRQSNANLQKAQDDAAYRGGGDTGDLAEYRAGEANRNLQSQLGDSLRGLGSDTMQRMLAANMWQQEQQDSANRFKEQAQMARDTASEQSNQFGAGYGLDFSKSALAEKDANIKNLMALYQMLGSMIETGQKKPTSSSSGSNFNMGWS